MKEPKQKPKMEKPKLLEKPEAIARDARAILTEHYRNQAQERQAGSIGQQEDSPTEYATQRVETAARRGAAQAADTVRYSVKKTGQHCLLHVSGFSAAICGILVASRMSSAQPMAGNGYEMEAIAAAVLGGIAIGGGEGNILNTIIGALMMGVIRNGLNLIGVNSYWQQVVISMVLVIAVANLMRRRRA